MTEPSDSMPNWATGWSLARDAKRGDAGYFFKGSFLDDADTHHWKLFIASIVFGIPWIFAVFILYLNAVVIPIDRSGSYPGDYLMPLRDWAREVGWLAYITAWTLAISWYVTFSMSLYFIPIPLLLVSWTLGTVVAWSVLVWIELWVARARYKQKDEHIGKKGYGSCGNLITDLLRNIRGALRWWAWLSIMVPIELAMIAREALTALSGRFDKQKQS